MKKILKTIFGIQIKGLQITFDSVANILFMFIMLLLLWVVVNMFL